MSNDLSQPLRALRRALPSATTRVQARLKSQRGVFENPRTGALRVKERDMVRLSEIVETLFIEELLK
jgi:hypothetical protein